MFCLPKTAWPPTSQTERNLILSFAGESQARNRYTFYASKAKNEGYPQISQIFYETAENEVEHAKRFFKFLEGGEVEITGDFPAGVIGETLANLKSAAGAENHEYSTLYPTFAKIAKEEGFPEIAAVFTAVAVSEKQHEKRFLALANALESGKLYKKDQSIIWKCINCGYIYEGTDAPKICPACAHPQGFFEPLAENF